MKRIIIHVDMDAFFAAVEVRDNPDLAGKPLIIGALPGERGVVSTCSYEARKYGVRSAMSIAEAYRRCPDGLYMHPSIGKYKVASDQVHEIWGDYTDKIEYISLDEGYLDVSGSAHLFGGARHIAREIKRRTLEHVGLTCSVGIGYSMMSAKLASEEKKPDGYFEILTPEALRALIIDRNVRIIYGVGAKTAELLERAEIRTVRDIYENRARVISLLGKTRGAQILDLADGRDDRAVTRDAASKSLGKEHTFQQDIGNFDYLRDALLLIAKELSYEIHHMGIFPATITLKITYGDMRSITRSKTGQPTNRAEEIFEVAAEMLGKIEKKPVRLIGISLSGFSDTDARQISFMDKGAPEQRDRLDAVTFELQKRYGKSAIKTGHELIAEKRLEQEET